MRATPNRSVFAALAARWPLLLLRPTGQLVAHLIIIVERVEAGGWLYLRWLGRVEKELGDVGIV